MRRASFKILCCPICKGEIKLKATAISNDDISEGSMVCDDCGRTYGISKGIPRLYIPDDEAIACSDQSQFDEFIITPQRLSVLTTGKRPMVRFRFLSNMQLSRFLVFCGWLSLLLACFLVGFRTVNIGSFNDSENLLLALVVIVISFSMFLADYLLHRKSAKALHVDQLLRLAELCERGRLSEYDSRLVIRDKKECYEECHKGLLYPHAKVNEIVAMLNKYNLSGGKGLNVGCNGELCKSVSQPFFNKKYDMVGVDISEEYLLEYSEIFDTDAIQANAMALPFKEEIFDLINYTDIVEHLHHPFWGLCEARRVLKTGGVILLATNYRCRANTECMNPIILIERLISLYYDKILGPRVLLSRFQDMEYYHLEFSRGELLRMLECSGFDVVEFATYFAKSQTLTKLFRKLPVLELMGTSITVVAKKRGEALCPPR